MFIYLVLLDVFLEKWQLFNFLGVETPVKITLVRFNSSSSLMNDFFYFYQASVRVECWHLRDLARTKNTGTLFTAMSHWNSLNRSLDFSRGSLQDNIH